MTIIHSIARKTSSGQWRLLQEKGVTVGYDDIELAKKTLRDLVMEFNGKSTADDLSASLPDGSTVVIVSVDMSEMTKQ